MYPRNPNDFTDDKAMASVTVVAPAKTATSYNEPGLPSPPAGYGKQLGYMPAHAPDTSCG